MRWHDRSGNTRQFTASKEAVRADPQRALAGTVAPERVFSTLTFPDGRSIPVMREDAYRAALAKAAKVR